MGKLADLTVSRLFVELPSDNGANLLGIDMQKKSVLCSVVDELKGGDG